MTNFLRSSRSSPLPFLRLRSLLPQFLSSSPNLVFDSQSLSFSTITAAASSADASTISLSAPAAAPSTPSALSSTLPVLRFVRHNSPAPLPFDHSLVLSSPPLRVTTLPNGLRVATEVSGRHLNTATVGVWIDAGSRFESDATSGTAHFLEHMIFKGTRRRSVGALESEVEDMGGHLNAYTSREQTTFFAKVLSQDVPRAVDILSDILQHSAFEERHIERERSVILREMEEVEKQPEEVLFDHLHATAFQFSPLGRTILGAESNVRSIQKQDLEAYVKTHYTGPRMVVAAAGAVDHEAFVSAVSSHFSSLSSSHSEHSSAAELVRKSPSTFTGSEVRIRDDDIPLCHFAVAFEGARWTDPDALALMVMQTMLGAWSKQAGGGKAMGSELAQKVAANDLAESFSAFNTNYADTGLFGVYAAAQPNVVDDLAWAVMHEVTKMVYRVAEEDVVRAKNQLKSSILLHLDGTSAVAEDIGRQFLTYGRRIPLAELFARLDRIDAEAVKRVADRFIFDKDVVISAMGSTQFLPDYNWFRRRTYWLRY